MALSTAVDFGALLVALPEGGGLPVLPGGGASPWSRADPVFELTRRTEMEEDCEVFSSVL